MAKFLFVSLLFPSYKNMKEKQSTLVDLSFLLNGKLQQFGQGPFPFLRKISTANFLSALCYLINRHASYYHEIIGLALGLLAITWTSTSAELNLDY